MHMTYQSQTKKQNEVTNLNKPITTKMEAVIKTLQTKYVQDQNFEQN